MCFMLIEVVIKNKVYEAKLEENSTAKAFVKMLPLTLNMDYMEHEKYCYMDRSLPTNKYSPNIIEKGDLMLYGDNCIVLFYKTFSTRYSYSKIGKIIDPTGLEDDVGEDSISVTFKTK